MARREPIPVNKTKEVSIMPHVISVAHFAENPEVMAAVLQSDEIRRRALKICLAIPGYNELPLEEKNAIYGKIRDKIRNELSQV
jgi:hypothetical protein